MGSAGASPAVIDAFVDDIRATSVWRGRTRRHARRVCSPGKDYRLLKVVTQVLPHGHQPRPIKSRAWAMTALAWWCFRTGTFRPKQRRAEILTNRCHSFPPRLDLGSK